ncbi:MAG: glycosyltransferase family 4 protein [Bacteroidales bacterium]|nr:glycosyltransferase family 4 protein [Bacteroidales bacterium]
MILHITNDFSGSTVYQNLIRELDDLGSQQIIYTPIKSANNKDKNEISLKEKNSKFIYSNILNLHIDRLLYRHKIKKIFKDIESKVELSKIKYIHAHTWYSDGGVALLIHKKYNIPYFITVRNSDLNVFYKYLPHERSFGCTIVRNAQKIFLISASYKNRFTELDALQSLKKGLINKIEIIPNGVDVFWIENFTTKYLQKENKQEVDILFIGKFAKGKKIVELQKAIVQLNRELDMHITLHIVGGKGSESNKVMKLINDNPDMFQFYGIIYDKNELLHIIRKCDIFAMPSKSETFGLVYVEAMLQGLPILYTKNEGIDGFYDEPIGEKVSKDANVQEIKQKLQLLILNQENYSIPIDELIRNHDWKLIAKKYKDIYKNNI